MHIAKSFQNHELPPLHHVALLAEKFNTIDENALSLKHNRGLA